ncbi:DUF402 domain-containing protein [Thermococcus bergensis]|uniref:DUF402 domain-containing protein n=1 Tax=Thermococcus bergensis TaxID=2689387 RepID=UPI001CED5617|nr:DUF402 domain-containing protein [Thermococcus bergensis]MCA6214515.1 DUF402 domain-containing protein [Thermococcus bergensis]
MAGKVHLLYKRIPNRILERDDELIADLGDIIVAKSKFEGMLTPLFVNGVKVIENGYTMIYFAFIGENYDILKVYDREGNFKGLYVDVLAYTKREGDTLEMLDLFLDIFIFPNGEIFLLDEDELEMALLYELIDKETFDFAYSKAREIIEKFRKGLFPPDVVWQYSLSSSGDSSSSH